MCTERVGISFRTFLLVWSIGSVTGRSEIVAVAHHRKLPGYWRVGKPCASTGAPGGVTLATGEKNYAKTATALQY